MTGTVRAINCPSCGAGQDVLGGGRVQTHVCPYCGGVLDAHEDFRLIAQYADMERPHSPLSLGDTGRIEGVSFTVIGKVGWVERYGGRTWHWLDHQIYSPTHGYAWITLEASGHLTFTRRLRRQPSLWYSARDVELAERRPRVWLGDRQYDYYESSLAEIDFVEGAFNWTPRLGDATSTVTFVGPDGMLALNRGEGSAEREVELTRLLSDAEQGSFGIDHPAPRASHPLTAPGPWANGPFFKATAMAFLVLSVLLLLFTMMSGGPTLARTDRVSLDALPLTLEFETDASMNLISIDLQTDVTNGWAFFELELEDAEGETLFEGGREVSYYFGRDSEGTWTEGSRSGTLTFRSPAAQSYTLHVDMTEFGSGEVGTRQTNSWISATARGRTYSPSPMWKTVFLFGLVFAACFAYDHWRRNRKFAGSDWSDDD
ncbi:DUF4178 domain-containing protein [Pseudoponticoccus marisrubri]|uniref:DUF4178 domain-containing protein n=1 Tax=Pseudoponticoccus marisrubri TaxID=1685382 RepID=A0A0W7WPD5_9RHOB|nr:DUF4178 domain-containing protein [Pseudoponticoccus marisrubri]KUF12462.1 hypothetical protein AVJ23_01650 [Pseudoponticoccus marisrubri]